MFALRFNRKIVYISLLCILLLSTALFAGGGQEQTEAPAENTGGQTEIQTAGNAAAATVNGVIITEEELQRSMTGYIMQAAQQGQFIDESQIDSIRSFMLENLIGREILIQEAEKKNITVSTEDIDMQIEAVRSQFNSEEEYMAALDGQGFTEAALREEFKNESLLNTFFETEVYTGLAVSESEKQDFYNQNPQYFTNPEQVQASHILITLEASDDEAKQAEAKEKIEKVQGILADGADFAETAIEYSEGPSAPMGGDLGYFEKGRMVPEFEEAAFALDIGEISDVVKTQFGYHIIKVFDRTSESITAYSEVQEQIAQFLLDEKQSTAVSDLLSVLIETADVVITPQS